MDQPSAPCAQIDFCVASANPWSCRSEVQWPLSGLRNVTEAFLPHLPAPASQSCNPFPLRSSSASLGSAGRARGMAPQQWPAPEPGSREHLPWPDGSQQPCSLFFWVLLTPLPLRVQASCPQICLPFPEPQPEHLFRSDPPGPMRALVRLSFRAMLPWASGSWTQSRDGRWLSPSPNRKPGSAPAVRPSPQRL